MSHRMSHVTYVNESRHTCEWVTAHMWMSHVTYVNESRHICEWVTSHMWMSHVTYVNESYRKCEWVLSHMCMPQVVTHPYVGHALSICGTLWDMTHPYAGHLWDVTHAYVGHAVCDVNMGMWTWGLWDVWMSHGYVEMRYVWHDSFKRLTDVPHVQRCSVLQCVAACCSVLQRVFHVLQHTATHCNTLQHTATHCNVSQMSLMSNIWMRVTYEWVTWHNSCIRWTCPTYAWVMSHIFEWESHMKESRPHVQRMHESRLTDLNESCPRQHVQRMHAPHVGHDSFICDTSCGTCLIHMWHVPHVGHVSFICDTCMRLMWDMTHSYVTRLTVEWLIHMWDMPHSYVGHDLFICWTWLIHMWDMTHSYVGHDSFICGTCLIHMWHVSRLNESCHT